MNEKDLLYRVKQQLSKDLNCFQKDFGKSNMTTNNTINPERRGFFKNENFLYAVNFGENTIISCDETITDWVKEFISTMPFYRLFDSVQLDVLNNKLKLHGQRIGIVGEYFLPKVKFTRNDYDIKYHVKIYKDEEIKHLYSDQRFAMALMYKEEDKRRDNVAVVAYNFQDEIMGVAGSTLDSNYMCSVGIDVLPEYRRQGVATTLVKIITDELLNMDLIPYYGTSPGNIGSKMIAEKAGYYPAWIEMHSKTIEESDKYVNEKFRSR